MDTSVNFVMIRRQFDFRAIEMGRWVTPDERDRAAVNFYRALCDLMGVLQGPETLISLRGTLGLQFGKGGRPGVAAHYMPATRQLALAKNAGAGSLAHEWYHAFDHYMGDKMFPVLGSQSFASANWLTATKMQPHPLNALLDSCFKAIMLNPEETAPSALFDASKRTDQALNIVYYAKPEELCARAFEAFIEDEKTQSRFLVKGSRYSDEAKSGLYPQGEQRQYINAAFKAYFSRLGAALHRQRS